VPASEFGAVTVVIGLTPPLLISNEPNGMPVRETPPDATGAVELAVIPVLLPPHGAEVPGTVGVPVVTVVPTLAAPVVDKSLVPIGVVPRADAVVPMADSDESPVAMPPPSKSVVEPDEIVVDGAIIEQGDVIVVMPVVPTVLSNGLTPGVESSVEPNGIPVGATLPSVEPSGDVALMLGVVVVANCAKAIFEANNAGIVNASNARRMGHLSSRPDPTGVRHRLLVSWG
jgi:hypothetical protein